MIADIEMWYTEGSKKQLLLWWEQFAKSPELPLSQYNYEDIANVIIHRDRYAYDLLLKAHANLLFNNQKRREDLPILSLGMNYVRIELESKDFTITLERKDEHSLTISCMLGTLSQEWVHSILSLLYYKKPAYQSLIIYNADKDMSSQLKTAYPGSEQLHRQDIKEV